MSLLLEANQSRRNSSQFQCSKELFGLADWGVSIQFTINEHRRRIDLANVSHWGASHVFG